MQRSSRTGTKTKNETKKEDIPSSSKKEEKKISTPRNFVQKSSTADIYGQVKQSSVHGSKTLKKTQSISNKTSSLSSMKDSLKSSPSTSSHRVIKQTKVSKDIQPKSGKTGKDLPVLNVTVNSPRAKRKLLNEGTKNETTKNEFVDKSKNIQDKTVKKVEKWNVDLKSKKGLALEDVQIPIERQRTKTRTLDESEVKILTTDIIDNNKEMLHLSQKLKAEPKAFFVDLDDKKAKVSTIENI